MSTLRRAVPLALLFCLALAGLALAADEAAVYVSAEGERLAVRYEASGSKARVWLPEGKVVTLPSARSASGARYSNGALTFWEHHGSAMLEKGDDVVFQGLEAAAPDQALREAVARYAAQLKRSDRDFAAAAPLEAFDCQLDAGKGRQPQDARCVNEVDLAIVRDGLASVLFVLRPVEQGLRKLPVLADGRLLFLMKQQKDGTWRGVHWYLGSEAPALGKKQMKASAITGEVLESVGWTPGS